MSNQTLAIIPARGGSKRIPRKNLREVDGRPLIAHTIHQVNSSRKIDRAVVSTDDEEIAEVASNYGGDVPFERPTELAADTASVAGTITHALEWVSREDCRYDQLCSLQVTSPLRTAGDIDNALTRLEGSDAESCVSISKFITPPQWAVTPDSDGFLSAYFDQDVLWVDEPDRSQEIHTLFHPNGAIYAATTAAWRDHESFYTPRTIGYQMPPERSFDIDEPWELDIVRAIMA